MDISIYDTAVGSHNMGDCIIMESVYSTLHDIFTTSHLTSFPTHYPLSKNALRKLKKNKFTFIGGTNLLSPKCFIRAKKNQLKIGLLDTIGFNECILIGVGCNEIYNEIGLLTRLFYNNILSNKYAHSVRDSEAERLLNSIGFDNVINTGCPTFWNLDEGKINSISLKKSCDVLFTLTDYNKDYNRDKLLIEKLLFHYKNIYFWKQGRNDTEYLKSILGKNDFEKINILPPSLMHLKAFLEQNEDVDYVGTRLHAGIFSLMHCKRSIIMSLDHRADMMNRDFGIPTLDRRNIDSLDELINGGLKININVPHQNINRWKNQFDNLL